MLRSLLLNLVFYPFTLICAASAITSSYIGGAAAMRWHLKHYSNAVLWLTKVILNARIEVRGLERFKDGARPALIVSKHQSELDIFLPCGLYPDVSAITMAELARYPLIGPVIRKLDLILVSVEGVRANQLRDVVTGAKSAYEAGRPILIYPEGELMRLGARERYKSGAFHIYQALGCEATPVALSCGLVWPKREWVKTPNQTCVIEFMEPIPPGLDQEAFMAEIERRIEGRSMALIREHGRPEVVAEAERRHRLGVTNRDDERRPPIPGLTDDGAGPGADGLSSPPASPPSTRPDAPRPDAAPSELGDAKDA